MKSHLFLAVSIASVAVFVGKQASAQSCSLPPGTGYSTVHYLRTKAPVGDPRCNPGPGTNGMCDVDLQGVLYEPKTAGKHPVVIFNHGSERMQPLKPPENDKCDVAQVFVKKGFTVFAPYRRGHGLSTGIYEGDFIDGLEQAIGTRASERAVGPFLTAQTDDVKAALHFVKNNVTHIDPNEIAVMGHSYGGMVTLFTAVNVPGFKAAIDVAGGALSWKGNPFLREYLKDNVRRVKIPTFLIQDDKECADNDPTHTLGPLLPAGSSWKVYHAFPEMECHEAHGKFIGDDVGQNLWAPDVLRFLKQNGVEP